VSRDLVVVVRNRLAGNAREAGESDLGGADDPDRFSALASHPTGVRSHCLPQAPHQVLTIGAGIGREVKLNVSLERDRDESSRHAVVLEGGQDSMEGP
jgi:hypothetical protein